MTKNNLPKAVFNAFADPNTHGSDYTFNLQELFQKIDQKVSFKTNHMAQMHEVWFEGFDVYLVDNQGNEVKLCNESNLTPREIRPVHNVYKMWRATAFGAKFVYLGV